MSAEPLRIHATSEADSASERVRVDRAIVLVRKHVDDAVECVGGMDVAAGIARADRSDLRRAIDNSGRHLTVQHAIAIGARLRLYNPSLSVKLGSALVEAMDLEVFPRVSLSDKEIADRLTRLVRSLPLGEQLLSETLKGGAR